MVLRVQVELTTLCTYSCPFCPRFVIPRHRNLGTITLEAQAILLDRLEEYPGELAVSISGFGEPLTYSGVFNFMDELKSRRPDIILELNSNGALLDEYAATHLIDHLDELQISLNLPTRKLHDEFKGEGSYRKVYDNLTAFYLRKGNRKPKTDIRLLHFGQTKGAIKHAIMFWGLHIGAEEGVRNARFENWMGLIDESQFGIEYMRPEEYTAVCNDLKGNHLTITKEGRAFACCFAIALPEGHFFELGNIRDHSLQELLDSEKIKTLREEQEKGIYTHECKSCSKPMVTVEPFLPRRFTTPNWVDEVRP